jgi:esterase/lipase superfamily enzyme
MSYYIARTELTYEVQFAQEVSELNLVIGSERKKLIWDEFSSSFKGAFLVTTPRIISLATIKLEGTTAINEDILKGSIVIKNKQITVLSENISKYIEEDTFSFNFEKVFLNVFEIQGNIDNVNEIEYEYEYEYERGANSGDSPLWDADKSKPIKNIYSKENKGAIITLFYGTNRKKTGSSNPNEFYGDELGEMQYGACTINIPKKHKEGDIERPKKILWLWQLSENEDKHIILKKIEEKSETDFYGWLKNSVPETDNKSGLIFVHGYNNSFAEAAWRTGQIAFDTPFNGLTGFFSWPSAGKTLDYLADGEKAITSVPKLEKFIEDFIIKTGVEKLHIIAHSMGNVVVTNALKNLVNKPSFKPYIGVIDQIVLAAPDIDQDVFNETLLPSIKNIGSKRTLYASDKDIALKISEAIRKNRPRLGQGGNDIFVGNGLDSVDASNIMSEGNHHSYIFETKELLTDMNILFEDGWNPDRRRLINKDKNGFFYWLFRE